MGPSRRPLPLGLCRVVWAQSASIVARLLRADGARRGGASIKTLTLAPGVAAKKATHAIVCETIKHIPLLKLVLHAAGVPLTADIFADKKGGGGGGKGAKNGNRRPGDDDDADDDDYVDGNDDGEDDVSDDGKGDEEEEAEGDYDDDDDDEGEDGVGAKSVHVSMAYVLAYELLFGAGINNENDPKDPPAQEFIMCSLKKAMALALKRKLRSAKVPDAESFLMAQPGGRALRAVPSHSRHVRVNTLKITMDAAEKVLSRLRPTRDPHVPNLLVLPAGTDLHNHAMVKDGRQGRYFVLHPPPPLKPNHVLKYQRVLQSERLPSVSRLIYK
jgi:hypothetical protein